MGIKFIEKQYHTTITYKFEDRNGVFYFREWFAEDGSSIESQLLMDGEVFYDWDLFNEVVGLIERKNLWQR